MASPPSTESIDAKRDEKRSVTPDDAVSIHVGVHMDQKVLSVWTAMGIGHSISNTAITVTAGLASGVAFGGPPLIFYGFIIMAIVALLVAISLGELSSAFPHSGGQYVWVATLAPPHLRRFFSYTTGILGWAGAVCTAASSCLAIPLMVFGMIELTHPGFDYKPWMGFVGCQVVNLVAFFFNLVERFLPWISRSILIYTTAVLTAMFVARLAGNSTKQRAENFFGHLYNISGWPDGVAFLIGLNSVNWGFSCLDAAAHLADEIPEPRKNIPKALLCTVALGSLTGLLVIFALFFAAADVEAVAAAGTPSLEILHQVFTDSTMAPVALQTLVAISDWGAVVGTHTWQSRIAFAFSNDRGFPFHRYLGQLAPRPFDTPIWAHIWSSAWTAALGCLYLGSTLAFNSLVAAGILLQYITYATSIVFLLWRGRSNIAPGPFWFPRLGFIANVITIAWTLLALVFYSLPYYMPVKVDQMNYVSCVVVGTFLYALVYWVLYGRVEYQLPSPYIDI